MTFQIRRIFGIFVCTDNTRVHAGTVRLFHQRGFCVYQYIREANAPEWAIRRMWHFFFFGLVHIGEGKSTSIPGWHLLLPKLILQREHDGFSIRIRRLDRDGSITATRWQRIKERRRLRQLARDFRPMA